MNNNQLLLLREYSSFCKDNLCLDLLSEQEKLDIKQNNAMYLTGIFQRFDTINANGRTYPERVLRKEVENYQKLIREKRSVGTLNHENQPEISLDKISHIVTRLIIDGKEVIGTLKLLNTPSGKIARTLIEDGVSYGISSRALGSLQESSSGAQVVQEDLQLISFDLVAEPSTPGAFMTPTMLKESREEIFKKVFSRSDRLYRLMGDILG